MPQHLGTLLGTVLVFAGLGPPIGAIAYSVFLAADTLLGGGALVRLGDVLFLLSRSHVAGGLPALLVGLGVAAIAARRGRAGLFGALVLTGAVLIGLAAILFFFWRMAGTPHPSVTLADDLGDFSLMLLIYSAASFPATAACWAISRWRRLV